MKYLFTNKIIHAGDVGIVVCLRGHATMLHLLKYFPNIDITNIFTIGIKFIKVYSNYAIGYLIHKSKTTPASLYPHKYNGKLVFLKITNHNNIGIIKYK